MSDYVDGNRKIAIDGDFIISRLRSYLKEFAVVKNHSGKQVFSTEYLVYRSISNEISSNTLLAFCLTKHVQIVLNHSQYGTAHPRFYEFAFNELPIPASLLPLNGLIDVLFSKAYELRNSAEKTYALAEKTLLSNVNLDKFDFGRQSVNVKSLSESFLSSGRLDAEFYQPIYDKLFDNLTSNKYEKIKNIVSFNSRGVQPIYIEDGEINVINSKHILAKNLDYNNFEKTNLQHWKQYSKAQIQKNDILTYTTGANIGRTQIYLSNEPALASNHVNILRVNEQNPIYISFVLNSIIGKLQTEKFSAGSAQAELYPKDLDEFIIPIVNPDIQLKIASLVEKSFQQKEQSDSLINFAKEAIELAIDKNLNEAMHFLQNILRNI